MFYLKEDAQSNAVRAASRAEFDKYGASVINRVDKIFKWAEGHYPLGQYILECMDIQEVANSFSSLLEAKKYCRAVAEREQEVRSTAW